MNSIKTPLYFKEVDAATIEASTIAPVCCPGRSVPANYIHGTTDPLVLFTGGHRTAGGTAGGFVLQKGKCNIST
ncbi:MAG: hypothetical protein NT004_05090 [Bacteroidetes bacterium]|nr:hypothetical protein [Bacteroidota bacterium]